ncbi:class I SAM-dependent methyltransferase [Qipengyuania sediminis]|uniref:class I SAM-dependent methyltransferase n=1 Tax=Qipengyuania sediminis TaxID=1532023 RepID=UPI00140437C5|nr:class I SAM-dependent methyltransferase [Qipengyuania sediminis]
MSQPADPYAVLAPIQRRYGSTCSPSDFYWAVNDAFHTAEAAQYDTIHAGMFLGQEDIWRRLFALLPSPSSARPLRMLDIGAGTGLVGEYLSKLAPNAIGDLTLLEPNDAMIAKARERAAGWGHMPMEVQIVKGLIDRVEGGSFDVISVSSVMHHVVEIEAFCAAIVRLLAPGGFLFQMQDPRADSDRDPILQQRRARVDARRRPGAYRALRNRIRQTLEHLRLRPNSDPVAEATSAALLAQGVIAKPMPPQAIWSVTDFHVPGQMEAIGKGFSVPQLQRMLAPLELVDSFTYQFHATAWDFLSPEEQAEEDRLWAAGDMHGAIFGTAWRAPEAD